MRFAPDVLKKWQTDGVKIEISQSTGITKKSEYATFEEMQKHDLLHDAHNLNMSIFLLAGSKDESIPPDHVQKLYDVIPSENKTFKIIAGAPHTYTGEDDLNSLRDLLDNWLKNCLF